jgi:hypothetical protein
MVVLLHVQGYTMRGILAFISKALLAFGFIISIIASYAYYNGYPAIEFCDNVDDSMNPSQVMDSAKQKGLPIINLLENRMIVMVLNHKKPFFRVACEIKFNNDQIISKNIVTAD